MAPRTRSPSIYHGFTWYLGLLLQCLIGSVLAQTAATDGPGNFQGLYPNPTGTVERVTCDASSIFAYSSTFAGCCRIGLNCNFPTACANGKPTNRKGGAWSCGEDRDCYTMTVYGNYQSATESWVVHNCAQSWSASTIYRTLPPSMMTATTSGGGGDSSITTSSSSTAAADSSGITPGGGPAESTKVGGEDPPVEEEPESRPSQAWIAGVVIGCLAGGAALGGLGVWLARRRRQEKDGGDSGGEKKGGFALQSATLVRSGRHWYSKGNDDEARMARIRERAVVVADGVEMEGHAQEKVLLPTSPQEAAGTVHVELDSRPAKQSYFV
ncbi:hypothetical protein C8A00DRAFT_36714 [Chaetomidium leptoderma]|uniref:Uncharacterized protein n=1 Tax=Chaetomidium leptoderma TaxID=669021 RepID=A0AAN6ZVT2_9PEZI|nr:hypothetical protein C8A00DRAFT_36714 [Chaetomidium leptoderma]